MPSLRTATIRVTGANGVSWEETGEGLRRTAWDLVRRRAAALSAADPPAAPDEQPRLSTAKDETLRAALRRVAANARGALETADAPAMGERP